MDYSEKLRAKKIRIVTRSSPLAMAQTEEIIKALLEVQHLSREMIEIIPVKNAIGDTNLTDPLYAFGVTGVFTKQVEKALLLNEADIAVHSLKDLPTIIDSNLIIAAYTKFQDRRDSILFNSKHNDKDKLGSGAILIQQEQLPMGAIIGTSSIRRSANLSNRYPHLIFKNIRGNMNTRLQKLESEDYDAIILASAGIQRLGLQKATINLDEREFLYAPGQGALAVQCRIDDLETIDLLKHLNHRDTEKRCIAERQFLNKLEGGCKLPIGVYSEINEDGMVFLTGQVWGTQSSLTIRENIVGEYDSVGEQLALQMRGKGADKILEQIRQSQTNQQQSD